VKSPRRGTGRGGRVGRDQIAGRAGGAVAQFCVAAENIEALDRYGKLLTDDATTVGDIQTLGADLVEPRETVASLVNEVEEAKAALAAAGQER
jgi:hypothetical protein